MLSFGHTIFVLFNAFFANYDVIITSNYDVIALIVTSYDVTRHSRRPQTLHIYHPSHPSSRNEPWRIALAAGLDGAENEREDINIIMIKIKYFSIYKWYLRLSGGSRQAEVCNLDLGRYM